jgi:hypothetical protein
MAPEQVAAMVPAQVAATNSVPPAHRLHRFFSIQLFIRRGILKK